jgi:chromosome segregation ATPase
MTDAEREEAWWREQLALLEAELAKHLQTQAFLQQACSEMEQDREQDQRRILELENQSAEMQEQILRQAQQASEYETAIQHWKDRFYQLQNQMLSILELYDQLSEPIPDAIAALLDQLPQPTASEQMQSLRRALPRRSDLPEFLQRRRGGRKN